MSRARWLIILFGPLPITVGALAVSRWAVPERPDSPQPNEVVCSEAAIPSTAAANENLTDACRLTARQWQHRLGRECQVVQRPPFVLAGDMSAGELRGWYQRTILPASQAMAADFFQQPPTEPISVLLFSGESVYNRYTDRLFGEHGISVYGYYKPGRRTLVMNIGTGAGTLVHELTHALLAFDFPEVPDWFNEGLASMHEQCCFRQEDGRLWIEGLPNWRLAALQDAVRRQRLRSLVDMMNDREFRGPSEAVNYAQARHFCLFMQQRGVLRDYYGRLRSNHAHDPHGQATVLEVFPGLSQEEVEAAFRQWAMSLESPLRPA